MHKGLAEIKEVLQLCDTSKRALKVAKCHSHEAVEYAKKIWTKQGKDNE